MKRKELTTLWDVLVRLKFEKADPKFTYCISKNKKILLPLIEKIEESKTRSDEYLAYDAERLELCVQFAEKDELGNAIIEDGVYKISNVESFDELFEALKVKHSAMFEAEKLNKKKFDNMMEEELDISLHTVALNFVPSELSIEYMDTLMDKIIVEY